MYYEWIMHLLCLIYLEYVCVRSINCCSAECRALPDEIVFSTLAAAAIASCEDGKDSDGGGSFNDALTAVFECIKKTSTATYDGAGQSMGQPIVHKGQKRVYVQHFGEVMCSACIILWFHLALHRYKMKPYTSLHLLTNAPAPIRML